MTPEAQRIAIAKYLNWPKSTVCPYCKGNTPYEAGDDYGITLWEECNHCNNTGKVPEYFVRFPYFTTDLNLIRDAVLKLPKGMRNRYVNELQDIIQRDNDDTLVQPDLDFYWCNAPANQMSEAFLRTLNLWTDDQ